MNKIKYFFEKEEKTIKKLKKLFDFNKISYFCISISMPLLNKLIWG
jgi:hypothetical protein